MDTWVQVDKFQDGDSVNSETLNTPIDQLSSRTEYLKRKLASLKDDGFQSALVLSDVSLDASEADKMSIGSVVYLDGEGGCKLAQAKMHLYDNFTADETAFTIGVLIDKNVKTGDVLIYGKLDIGDNPLLTASGMLQSGEVFRAGRYYLSANEPGKITANPGGPVIYIGSFHSNKTTDNEFSLDAVACINPQFMDIGTSHVHRAYPLVARPAGHIKEEIIDPNTNKVKKNVIGYLPDSHGSESKQYPSLIFGGTWTQKDGDRVNYRFVLSDSSSWGNVTLSWNKNNSTSYQSVEIPAPGVFVNLDNGLQVKVMFPGATSSNAFSDLTEEEKIWNLTFPDAGKGWVNHEVTTIASVIGESQSQDSNGNTPEMHALITGSLSDSDQDIYIAFPTDYTKKTLNPADLDKITIGSENYQFVTAGQSADSEYTPVAKAATVPESLKNLAETVNNSIEEAKVLFNNKTLYVIGSVLYVNGSSVPRSKYGADFNVIGGTIQLLIAYKDTYETIGTPIQTASSTYTNIALGNTGLKVLIYADNATSGNNYTCVEGTCLKATMRQDPLASAIYEYVMGLHQSIDYYFPPVPAQSAGLFVNGVEMENAALFPDNPTYTIGRKTIYWMEDDAEHLPWPAGITGHDDPVLPSDDKTMAFYFTVGFQGATGPVTSIVPAPNSPLKIYTYGTKETAYTGDLEIDAAFDFKVNDANIQGYNVAKQGAGGELLAGPVVEKIRAGNGLIVKEDPGCPKGQGTLTISLDNGTIRDQFSEIALENAKQEKIGLLPYISLLGWNGSYGNIPSAFTMMMRVPTNLDPAKDYQLNLKMTMFGTVGFSESKYKMAGIKLEYNILPDYTGDQHASLASGLIAPMSPRQINVPFGHVEGNDKVYTAYDPFVAATNADAESLSDDVLVNFSNTPIPSSTELNGVTLKPGYLVAIRISRTSPTNTGGSGYFEYRDPIGFLSLNWELDEVK